MSEHAIVLLGLSIFYPVVLVLLILLIRGMGTTRTRKSLSVWHEAAVACGLQVEETVPFRACTSSLEVRFDTSGGRDEKTQLAIRIPGPPDVHKVRIRPEAAQPDQLYPWTPEIEIGDARFDATFRIEGPSGLVLALLDAQTRQLLLDGNAESEPAACAPEISLGELRTVVLHKKLLSILPRLLEVGQRLARPIDVSRRVADNARQDPEAGVRLQNLLLLVREFPGAPVTLETLRAACSDPSPQIRLRAAKELGAEGRGILLELAESEEDDALSAGAVSILDRELPVERLEAILGHALDGRRNRTARACVEVLGHVGSASAVLPLKEAAERSSDDPDLRRATRQAIAEIQSRLPAASPGQLSLGEAEAGRLSLAQAEAGQLSMAAEAGHLSLAQDEVPLLPHAAAEPEQPPPNTRETPGVRQG